MIYVLIAVLAVVVLALLFFVLTYNRLVRLRNACQNAWAQVDVQLKRRHDLIPNLVESVKGYAAHERGTFEAVTEARTAAQKAQICGMADVIDQELGRHGHLFRPPYGSYDDGTKRAAAQCGDNAVITWRAALNDGMVQIQGGDRLVPGDIILSHFRPDLYDNLVELWDRAQEWGLSFAALEAYLPPPSK